MLLRSVNYLLIHTSSLILSSVEVFTQGEPALAIPRHCK